MTLPLRRMRKRYMRNDEFDHPSLLHTLPPPHASITYRTTQFHPNPPRFIAYKHQTDRPIPHALSTPHRK